MVSFFILQAKHQTTPSFTKEQPYRLFKWLNEIRKPHSENNNLVALISRMIIQTLKGKNWRVQNFSRYA